MRAVSPKRAKLGPVRAAAERALGRDENGRGTCARCGRYTDVNGHERIRRTHAGSDPSNPDCLLCQPCNGWAAHGARPCIDGWALSDKHDRADDLGPDEARCVDGRIHVFGSVTVS